jgi:ribosome maturation factor RimP
LAKWLAMDMEKDLKDKIKEIIEIPILKKNIELVDLEWKRERSGWVLRIFIDKPGGVTIGDCAKISELVGKILDEEDIIHRSYTLEVSSPGIERPLVKKEDYERFRGEKAKITLKEPIEGRKNFTGIIIGIKEDLVCIEVEGKVWEFPIENIKKANLQPEIKF